MPDTIYDTDQLRGLPEEVACNILGEPNRCLSIKHELRYGTKRTLSACRNSGRWHEPEAGFEGMHNGGVPAGAEAALTVPDAGDDPAHRAQSAARKTDLDGLVNSGPKRTKVSAEADYSGLIAKLTKAARPLPGTAAETYLRRCGMTSHLWPDTLLFVPHAHRICYPRSSKANVHALLAVARDLEGRVRRVQLVFITRDGRKATGLPVLRPTFGAPGSRHFAVILPAFMAGADVLVTEGSETGIAAWLATGSETILCLGPIRGDLCPRRPLIILRDADAAGSPADLGIRKRMIEMVIDGHDVRVAMAPHDQYPVGTRINDIALANGMDAVRQVVAAAERVLLPREMLPVLPHWPAPTEDREVALKRQRDLISAWCAEAAILARLEMETDRAREDLITRCRKDPQGGLGVIRRVITWTDRQPDQASLQSISNRARRAVLRRYGLDRKPAPARLAVTGSQGSGKTTAALTGLAGNLTGGTVAWFLLPTTRKAMEAAEDYEELRANEFPAAVPAMSIRGRSAIALDEYLDPALLEERSKHRLAGAEPDPIYMCGKHHLARKVAEAGLSVNRTLCSRDIVLPDGTTKAKPCDKFSGCPYQIQAEKVAQFETTGGVCFLSHDYAYLPPPVPSAHIVIADEDLTSKLPASRSIAEHAIDNLPRAVPEAAATMLRQIRDAVRYFPGIELLWLRDPTLAAEEDLSVEIRANLETVGPYRPLTLERLKVVQHGLEEVFEQHLELGSKDLSDEQLEALLEDPDRQLMGQAVIVLRQVVREFEMPRPGLVGVWYNPDAEVTIRAPDGSETRELQPRLQVHYLRDLAFGGSKPLLLLDGTGDARLMRIAYGEDLAIHRIAVERQAEVVQVNSRAFSRQSLTGMTAKGNPLSDTRLSEAAKLRAQFWHGIRLWGGISNFIACQAKVEDILAKEIPKDLKCLLGHYGLLRGINEYETCDTGFALGREQCSVEALEAHARAWQSRLPDMPIVLGKRARFQESERAYRLRSGDGRIGYVEAHPDPIAQAVLEQIREANLLQAINRVRAIYNQRRIFILTSIPLDITVDRLMDWDEFLRGPDGTAVPPHKSDRAQKPGAKVKLRQAIIAMARTGVVFLSRSEIARMNPEIYANPLELGQNSRWTGKEAEQQIRSYLDAAPFSGSFQKIVEYQRDKSVGRPARALIRNGLDPVQALEAVGVRVSWVRDVTPTAPTGVPLEEMFREVVRGRAEWKRILAIPPDELEGNDFELRDMIVAELTRTRRRLAAPAGPNSLPDMIRTAGSPSRRRPARPSRSEIQTERRRTQYQESMAAGRASARAGAEALLPQTDVLDPEDIREFGRARALAAEVSTSMPVSIDARLTVRVEQYRADYKLARRRLLSGETLVHEGQAIALIGETTAARMSDWTRRRQELEEILESLVLPGLTHYPDPLHARSEPPLEMLGELRMG